ncbi:transketolase [Candidatus Micropelagos thuwalensis]|nr:transketolase [Candidatus Micropelagos thuwalensis]
MSDNPKIRHNMMANAIRVLSMDAVQAANSGHPGLPMGAADIATVLFTKFLKIDPRQPDWPDRDRFVLSAGHGSMLLYSLHYLMGFEDMTLDEIKNFRQLGSRTAGHPEYGHAAGIETTTGPLGQGLATSVGMALAERMLNSRFGDDLVNHYTYVLASDGDLMEGISHEAISLAGHLKLSKLIVLYDDNDISIDGPLNLAESGDALGRFEAAGWFAERIDGHDPDAIEAAISAAQTLDKPTLIACKTTIGYGAPNKQGTSGVHGAPLGDEEISLTREALGWTSEPFDIPSDILDSWRMAGLKHVSERKAWQERLDAQDSEVSNRFTRVVSGDLPTRLEKAVQEYKQSLAENPSKLATRKSSEDALKAIVPTVPEMIGGSADLTGSNNTRTPEQEAVSADNYGGSFIHYGIREFGMAAAMNGMALHGGFIPYSGTFLVFSDYSRPALRLAALMEQRVIHVLTHDSIGLGEDGPTHQPVEHLAALRAIPNLLTLRPADATETLECWQIALEQSRTPSAMALTRQGLPAVRLEYSEKNLSAKGAYELASADGDALVTLLATGSEVHLAVEAKQQLEAENIGTRVISMPCFELFDKQKSSYRDDVLGNTPVRIAIEAAIRQGWDAYLRPGDGFIGMESFGASAPAERLFEHFGITVDTIVKNAKDRLDT